MPSPWFCLFVAVLFFIGQWFDPWALFSYDFTNDYMASSIKLGAFLLGFFILHFSVRSFSAKYVASKISKELKDKKLAGKNSEGSSLAGNIKYAFLKNTQPLRSIFRPMPVGWSMRSKRVLAEVVAEASEFIQTMNDRYTHPSGEVELPDQLRSMPAEELKSDDSERIRAENVIAENKL